MKRVLLIIGAAVATITASAQHHRLERYNNSGAEPTVYIISVSETDTVTCPTQSCNQQDMVMKNIHTMLTNFLLCPDIDNILFCWVMHQQKIVDDILSRLPLEGVKVVSVSLMF